MVLKTNHFQFFHFIFPFFTFFRLFLLSATTFPTFQLFLFMKISLFEKMGGTCYMWPLENPILEAQGH